jgi:hypothetical protein
MTTSITLNFSIPLNSCNYFIDNAQAFALKVTVTEGNLLMQRLVINPGSPMAREIWLNSGTNSFGRGPANDFQVEDPSVSGAHCHIVLGPDSIWIKDLQSTNGTFVDHCPVGEASVRPGQTIRLGNVELFLSANAPHPEATAPPPQLASPALLTTGAVSAASPELAPAPATVEVEKLTFCKNHYKTPARYQCVKCHKYFCDLCVNTRGSFGGGLKFCKVCGAECSTVSVLAHVPKVVDFYKSARQAFKYPFIGDGLMLLIGGTLFFGFLDAANYVSRHAFAYGMRAMMMRVAIFTFILGTGYLFSFLKNVIYCTAYGDEKMPDWPEISDWKADIVSPMFQFLVISVLCFGPALSLYVWLDGEHTWAVWLALIMGCVYFPMAFLAVAIFDSLSALNPLFVVGSILRVPREYGIAALVFTGIIVLRWLAETVLTMLVPIPLAPALVADLLGLGLLIVLARILGLLYLTQQQTLGWFSKKPAVSYRQAA